MLGKCIKHEFRATARQLVPLLIAQLAVSIFAGIIFGVSGRLPQNNDSLALSALSSFASGILGFAMVALIIATAVVAFVMIIRRFYTSFFTDEGYLTFTLPVTPNAHIFSKFITAYAWQVVTVVVSVLCIVLLLVVMALVSGTLFDASVPQIVELVISELELEVGTSFIPAFLGITVLNLLVGVAASVFMVYLAISIACMLAKKHRVILGIVSFYVINLVFSGVSQVLQMVLIFFTSDAYLGLLLAMVVSTVICIAQAILCYLGTKWVLTKKLNLD